MYANKDNERKQVLDITILKAYMESLTRKVDSFPGNAGIKASLDLISQELDETTINETRMKEIWAQLVLYGRVIRERIVRENREKEKNDSPFDKVGKTFTGEMEI